MDEWRVSFYFQDVWRMDWGLGNPNKTAALIATLMAGVWILAYLRKWGFWIALPLFCGLGISLLHTLSRGGVVAAIAGLSVIAWTAPRPWPKWRVGAIFLCGGVMLASGWVFKAPQRFTQSFRQEDKSVAHRLEIWRAAPRMMLDAPGGWGAGQAGEAYMQWYQPIGRQEGYRTLVNSHFTWLVEWGWPARLGYVCGWTMVFVSLWPAAHPRWCGVSLGAWVSFFVAAAFSSVAESWPLWLLPFGFLLPVLWEKGRRHAWPSWRVWLVALSGVTAILASLVVAGFLYAEAPLIHRQLNGVIVVGSNPTATTALISPAKVVLGLHYGHAVRHALLKGTIAEDQSVAISRDVKSVPTSLRIVFSGELPQPFPALSAKEIVLISPQEDHQLGAVSLEPTLKLCIIVGEFSRRKLFWKRIAAEHHGWEIREIPGTMDYLPNWEKEAFGGKQSTHEIDTAVREEMIK